MAEGFDDNEMQDLGEQYPEYNDMGLDDLDNRYDDLARERLSLLRNGYEDPNRLDEVKRRIRYIENLKNDKYEETTFASNDRRTVTIKRKTQRSNSAPEVQYTDPKVRPINSPTDAVEDFIQRNYKENFRFDVNNDRAVQLRLNIDSTGNNNIRYRPFTTRNERGSYQIVLKRDSNGVLQYNDAKIAERAVEQFKQEIQNIIDEQTDRENTVRDMPMIDTSINQQDDIPGLTPKEMSEYRGVMTPREIEYPEYIRPETRPMSIQAQAERFQELLDATKLQIENFRTDNNIGSDINLEDYAEYGELKIRAEGLEKARDDVLAQKQREDVREQQEEDINRLQKFKKWAKENMVGLTALSVSIAGLLTTLIVGARKAIVQGAQAASKFGKAIADLGKKLWPLLGPILGLIGTAISWGATGLAWLASNLWVLAVAFAWFIYDQYKQKRNKT